MVVGTRTSRKLRGIAMAIGLAPAGLLLAATAPALAQRDDPELQLACANDFFRLCPGVDPSSGEAERCMNRSRARFSPQCRSAVGNYEGGARRGRGN